MKAIKVIVLGILFFVSLYGQQEYKIMSYNLLNYPGNDTTTRNPYFRTVIANVQPDILVVQEMNSQAGVNGFLINVLNAAVGGYDAGVFNDGPDTDNAIFFKGDKFNFIANNVIQTTLRDINEFVLKENVTNDTIRIYSVHLKASSGSSNELQRLAEVTALRNVTDTLPVNSDFIVVGDYNIYRSSEPAFIKLLDQTTSGYFIDPLNLVGVWNENINFAPYHTQSPRTRQFGGGANGGLDDRFDMILMSQAVMDSGGIEYVEGSYITYGNDGFHFNDSINRPPNMAVSQEIADALHYGSDHIPVIATLRFKPKNTIQMYVNIENGWNLLSVPLIAFDMNATALFPTAITPFYAYSNGYTQASILENGVGYWAKFNGNQTSTITGNYVNSNSIAVAQGWNMIGPFSEEVNVDNITTSPPGILASNFYGYGTQSGYTTATTLQPGKGYWVKVNEGGVMQFNYIEKKKEKKKEKILLDDKKSF